MLLQLFQTHRAMHGHTVIHHMQIMILEINDSFATRILNVGVADVPLSRNGPIEDRGARRYFMNRQRNLLLQSTHCLAKPVSSDAAADWVQLFDKAVHRPPNIADVDVHWKRRAFLYLG